jgi:hypothetical protein
VYLANYQCECCWQHAKDNDKIFWQLKSFVLKKLVTQKNRGEKLVTTNAMWMYIV